MIIKIRLNGHWTQTSNKLKSLQRNKFFMNRELLLVRVHEELDLTSLREDYVSLVDKKIESRLRKGVTYKKHGKTRYIKMDNSLFPRIGENILRILPKDVVTNYRIHPEVVNFRYTPYATFRGLDIEDEDDMMEYHHYVTTSRFRNEKLATLDAYRVLGITGLLFYCCELEFPEKYRSGLPYLGALVTKFRGGVTRVGTNVSLVAMIGNSWEKQEKNIVTSTAVVSAHEIGHTFGLEHYSPHSGHCLMDVDDDVLKTYNTKFCKQCIKKLKEIQI
jgi:hypothetical protein